MFKQVSSQVNFPALEKEILDFWDREKILEKYLHKNGSSEKKFSFLDGPKTANNPLGVHHAWGRAYKDLWQRWFNMQGYKQRFQNGYDEQGLWVEVEVEKKLGLKSKRDIENIVEGDKLASLEKFIELCKERVEKYGEVITGQSKRLGQFMDWDNNYHTSSPQNNYMIWHFLKNVHQRGWLYKGRDSVPWCPRCGTAISQHEMQTEDYRELTHDSVYVSYQVKDRVNEYLLVWTTTPWTLPGNVAVAADPEKEYVKTKADAAGKRYYLGQAAAKKLGLGIEETVKGSAILGLEYSSPFDRLEKVRKGMGGNPHKVVGTDPLILPISDEEGTGLVHIAPGAGTEDFALSKKLNLPVIELIDEGANYIEGLGEFTNLNAKDKPEIILDFLKSFEEGKHLFGIEPFKHRYPACWRCKTELVWRVVNEWYIAVDKKVKDNRTFRQRMIEVAKDMSWQPKFVEKRELDWLEGLHDWMISKKRYWGLALPIWECKSCGNIEVVGGEKELEEKAAEGWEKFAGHTPHRPWIDEIKIKCSKCESLVSRIPDVGNVWLDAGIVPYSTITEPQSKEPSYIGDKKYWGEWFPPEFAVEMYEQTRLWFYAMIAMSAALTGEAPVKRIFGHGRVVDEKGEEMHGSKGNSISLDEAFDKVGADPMRWLYLTANPASDMRFGYNLIDEVKRRFILILWNTYKFFVDYASVYEWNCKIEQDLSKEKLSVLDRWILARLTEVVLSTNKAMDNFDAATASRTIEDFVVGDLSTWYVRRSRDRVGPEAQSSERNITLSVLYGILVTLSKLLAPFMPFVSEEIYKNLTEDLSVHLTSYPMGDKNLLDEKLVKQMKVVRQIVEIGHSKRKEAQIKLRQPLGLVSYQGYKLDEDLEKIIADELNVKQVEYEKSPKEGIEVFLDTKITPELKEEGEARDLIRQIQQLRKQEGLTLNDKIEVFAPGWPEKYEKIILKSTAAVRITKSEKLEIKKVGIS